MGIGAVGFLFWKEQYWTATVIIFVLLVFPHIARASLIDIGAKGIKLQLRAIIGKDEVSELDRLIYRQLIEFRDDAGRRLSAETINYFASLIIDSLITRQGEWKEKSDLDVGTPDGRKSAITRALTAIRLALEEVAPKIDSSTPISADEVSAADVPLPTTEISLSDANRGVHIKWCTVFPFCHPDVP